MGIQENLLNVRQRIALACSKVNRLPDSLTLVAVTKGRSAQEIKEVWAVGVTDIGESRVQEAHLKYEQLKSCKCEPPAKWHLVGHLQANKAKEAVKIFDLIQSVDSLHLAAAIDKQAASMGKIQDILIEVKTSPEATKFGLTPQETAGAVGEIARLKNINIRGLMTVAPLVDNPEKARPYFRMLRELKDKLNLEMDFLSMGMSDDFEAAIEEGANIVRIGRAIFSS